MNLKTNIPAGANFTFLFHDLIEMGTEEREAFMERIKKAYLKTGVACRNLNRCVLGQISVTEWQEINRKCVAKFVETHGWEHI